MPAEDSNGNSAYPLPLPSPWNVTSAAQYINSSSATFVIVADVVSLLQSEDYWYVGKMAASRTYYLQGNKNSSNVFVLLALVLQREDTTPKELRLKKHRRKPRPSLSKKNKQEDIERCQRNLIASIKNHKFCNGNESFRELCLSVHPNTIKKPKPGEASFHFGTTGQSIGFSATHQFRSVAKPETLVRQAIAGIDYSEFCSVGEHASKVLDKASEAQQEQLIINQTRIRNYTEGNLLEARKSIHRFAGKDLVRRSHLGLAFLIKGLEKHNLGHHLAINNGGGVNEFVYFSSETEDPHSEGDNSLTIISVPDQQWASPPPASAAAGETVLEASDFCFPIKPIDHLSFRFFLQGPNGLEICGYMKPGTHVLFHGALVCHRQAHNDIQGARLGCCVNFSSYANRKLLRHSFLSYSRCEEAAAAGIHNKKKGLDLPESNPGLAETALPPGADLETPAVHDIEYHHDDNDADGDGGDGADDTGGGLY